MRHDQSIDRLRDLLAPARDSLLPDESERFAAGQRSRNAAVALLLRPAEAGDDLELLLIRRAQRAGDVWSGHIGLPGGHRELQDPDLVHTAARETQEEVGIDLARMEAELLGSLPLLEPMNPQLPQLTVHPFVWRVPTGVEAALSDEVAAIRWTTIEHLRHVDNRIEHRLALPDGIERTFPAITLGEDVLWGMTHRIVHTLLDLLDD